MFSLISYPLLKLEGFFFGAETDEVSGAPPRLEAGNIKTYGEWERALEKWKDDSDRALFDFRTRQLDVKRFKVQMLGYTFYYGSAKHPKAFKISLREFFEDKLSELPSKALQEISRSFPC
jgi:hypothetical protein